MYLFFWCGCLHNPTQSKLDVQHQAVLSWWEKANENHSHRGVKSLMMDTPSSIFILKEIAWRDYQFTQRNGFLILEFHQMKGRRFSWVGIEILFFFLA